MNSKRLEEYRSILVIRRKADRRDLSILGGIFLLTFIALVALGLLDRLNQRSIYIIAGLVTVFAIVFLMAWARLEITRASLEMIEHLQAENRPVYE